MNLKKCKECGESKAFSAFYKKAGCVDGHQPKCKECSRRLSKERRDRLKKDPEWAEKEKERNREKYHRLGYKGKHTQSSEKRRETIKRYLEKFPEKKRAKHLSQHLHKEGFEKHHWSYEEGFEKDVIWLSNKSHNTVHTKIYYDQEMMKYRCLVDADEFKRGDLLSSKEDHCKFILKFIK